VAAANPSSYREARKQANALPYNAPTVNGSKGLSRIICWKLSSARSGKTLTAATQPLLYQAVRVQHNRLFRQKFGSVILAPEIGENVSRAG